MLNIKDLRKNAGLTQEAVGSNFGLKKAAISKWESGCSNPHISIVPKLAELYGVSSDDILAALTDKPDLAQQ